MKLLLALALFVAVVAVAAETGSLSPNDMRFSTKAAVDARMEGDNESCENCKDAQEELKEKVVEKQQELRQVQHQIVANGGEIEATSSEGGGLGEALAGDEAEAASAERLESAVNGAATRAAEARAETLNAEINTLERLISHAKDIQSAIPEKERRLAQLRTKLQVAAEGAVEKEATTDLEKQQDLLLEINNKIAELKAKLGELEATKVKIEKEIARLEREANGISEADAAAAGVVVDGAEGKETANAAKVEEKLANNA